MVRPLLILDLRLPILDLIINPKKLKMENKSKIHPPLSLPVPFRRAL
jgi:hypothetical protein